MAEIHLDCVHTYRVYRNSGAPSCKCSVVNGVYYVYTKNKGITWENVPACCKYNAKNQLIEKIWEKSSQKS